MYSKLHSEIDKKFQQVNKNMTKMVIEIEET